MSDVKEKVINALTILMKRETVNKAVFKVRAYKKVIEELKISNKPILTLEDLDDVPGVGVKIRKKVQEILETGGLAAAEKAKEEMQLNAIDTLSDIYGVGPVKAKELIGKGIKTISQLRDSVAKEPTLLNEKQKIGLKYYEDILKRIPRDEMELHEKLLLGNLMKGIVVDPHDYIVIDAPNDKNMSSWNDFLNHKMKLKLVSSFLTHAYFCPPWELMK